MKIDEPVRVPMVLSSFHAGVRFRASEVLLRIVCGHRNKEVRTCLGRTVNTMKNHVKMIRDKLGARDRTRAAAMATHAAL